MTDACVCSPCPLLDWYKNLFVFSRVCEWCFPPRGRSETLCGPLFEELPGMRGGGPCMRRGQFVSMSILVVIVMFFPSKGRGDLLCMLFFHVAALLKSYSPNVVFAFLCPFCCVFCFLVRPTAVPCLYHCCRCVFVGLRTQ